MFNCYSAVESAEYGQFVGRLLWLINFNRKLASRSVITVLMYVHTEQCFEKNKNKIFNNVQLSQISESDAIRGARVCILFIIKFKNKLLCT